MGDKEFWTIRINKKKYAERLSAIVIISIILIAGLFVLEALVENFCETMADATYSNWRMEKYASCEIELEDGLWIPVQDVNIALDVLIYMHSEDSN